MPYDIWEGKFQKRVAQWYKALQDCDGSVEKVRFWEIEKKDFIQNRYLVA